MKPKVIRNKLSITIIIALGILALVIALATWYFNKSFGRGMVGLAAFYLLQRLIHAFDIKYRDDDYKFTLPRDFRFLGSLFIMFILTAYAILQVTDMAVWIISLFR